ncbi:DUF397 domain-containing protein [Actinocorallia sp. API 0066]|uniref:DUF397 domain-containing protein n=1 Tax=Actinocorallia sp. API 0066 TaxID=2896846 RepID=UPI001E5DB79C|nr:DUF397 domain-containing protein [Actinocorallia sp. API 0066]MCD0448322.1 DUF397 domain-containing protein [Actinocorallia sp. API 0066]
MTTDKQFTRWRKSSFSGDHETCVEAGIAARTVGVRDTKQHQQGPVLEFSTATWGLFVTRLKTSAHPIG